MYDSVNRLEPTVGCCETACPDSARSVMTMTTRKLARRSQDLEHRAPRPGEVPQAVAAAAECHQPPLRMALREHDGAPRGVGMRGRRELQVRERIAGEPVGAALQDAKLRPRCVEEALGRLPCAEELRIAGPGRERQVELCAFRSAASRLVEAPGAGIQELAVLVDIDRDYVRVVFELVVHPVAMVHIDVHVSDAAYTVLGAQRLDEHPGIVEHAEAGGAPAARVVQAADRLERAYGLARHDAPRAFERRADDVRGDLVAAFEGGGVAVIQESLAILRRGDDPVYVVRRVEALDCGSRGRAGAARRHPGVQAVCAGELEERALPVDRERMTLRKAVAPELGANEEMRRHARLRRGSRRRSPRRRDRWCAGR